MRLLLLCLLAVAPRTAAAQDLFELEIFRFEGPAPGGYDVELHTNVLSKGGIQGASVAERHHPAHVSLEVARGFTPRVEAALFVQTAPFGRSGSDRLGGGHVRSKVRIGPLDAEPLRFAVNAEYGFNRTAFDRELQTFELRGIVDYEWGRLSLVANPSVEVVTRGADEGLEPVFDVSALAAWRLLDRLSLTAEYFSAAAAVRHLQPEADAHHLLFGGVDVGVGSRWELTLGAGHCITRGEPWLMKSVVGYSF